MAGSPMMALVGMLYLLGVCEAAKTRVTAMSKATAKATAKSLATAKASDPEDEVDVDGPAESGAPSGGADQAGVLDAFQADLAMRAAGDRQNMMKSFMHNFAKNMKMAVLSDSQGDMPEEERQRMMSELRGDGVPDQGEPGAPPPRRRRHRRERERMLNGGRPVEEEHHRVDAWGSPMPGTEPAAHSEEQQPMPEDDDAAPPPPRPHRRMMLNAHHRGKATSATKAKMQEVKQAHAAFMAKLNECADVDCVKQLYARQNQFHQSGVSHHSSDAEEEEEPAPRRRMPRRRAEADDSLPIEQAAEGEREGEDGPPPERAPDYFAEAQAAEGEETEESPPPERAPNYFAEEPPRRRRSRDDEDGEEGPPAEEDDGPRSPSKERHPTVRDELGRPMPLLFGSPAGAEQVAPEAKKSAGWFTWLRGLI